MGIRRKSRTGRLPLRCQASIGWLLGASLLLIIASGCLDQLAPSGSPELRLSPTWATVLNGDSVRLALIQHPSDTVPATEAVWSTSNPSVAVVDSTGLVTGTGVGAVFVRATISRQSATASVGVDLAVLVGAGDIGICGSSDDEATAAILDTIPGVIFTAGDNAYPDGSAREFAECYEPSWGRHRARTRPAPGNHDYHTAGASAYFAYFGANAGDTATGYYSYDLGTWHIIVLNSNVPIAAGSPQHTWLRADLAAHPARCTLAYWHHPRFSSGPHGSQTWVTPAWEALHEARAEVVVSGHDHTYERFAPQSPTGAPDAAGIREFVVGTGGASLYAFHTVAPNSEVRDNTTHGVLSLRLGPDRYEWLFVPIAGGTFTDTGTAECH